MRIIAGTNRGRKLLTLDGVDTRPTLDRVREALFNSLMDRVYDADVLDLFSGSGALSLEAISRGAKSAIMNDLNSEAIKVIKENVKAIKCEDKVTITNSDYNKIIENSLQQGKTFDIIFLDPPYKNDFYHSCVEKCQKLLKQDGIIVVEHDETVKFDKDVIKEKKYGKVYVTFIGGKDE